MNFLGALARCASCRYAGLYFLPFIVPIAAAGRLTVWWVVGLAVYWSVFSLAVELTNRLSDRVEDEVNRPERSAWSQRVGYDRIRTLAIASWVAVLAADVTWLVLRPDLLLGCLLALAVASGLLYSFGLRLKRHRFLALYVISFTFWGTYLSGWSVYGDVAGRPETAFSDGAGPVTVVLGLFVGTLAGAKDLTDIAGDEKVGYTSAWVSAVSAPRILRAAVLLALPFAAVVAFVAAGLMEPRFLAILPLAACSALLGWGARHAATDLERAGLREISYWYWVVFLTAVLVLWSPRAETVALAVASCAYWAVCSTWLHWSRGLRDGKLGAAWSAATRAAPTPAAGVTAPPEATTAR